MQIVRVAIGQSRFGSYYTSSKVNGKNKSKQVIVTLVPYITFYSLYHVPCPLWNSMEMDLEEGKNYVW